MLSSTTDTTGPYVVDVAIDGALGDRTVRLHVAIDSTDPGVFTPVDMTSVDPDDRLYSGSIAGQPAGTDVFYFVDIVDADGDVIDRDPANLALAVAFGFQVLPPNDAP